MDRPLPDEIPHVHVWVDPGCPWAWQTARWLRELRDDGILTLSWGLFSLELNAAPPGSRFDVDAPYGEATLAIAQALQDGGDAAFEACYVAIAEALHGRGEQISPELVRTVTAETGLGDIVGRARATPSTAALVERAYHEARALDVFGVPTLRIGNGPVMYGPILPIAPTGQEAEEWWRHIRWLIERDDLYELKRWPRASSPRTRVP